MMRRTVFATVVAVMFMLLCSSSALAVYSWVDEKGETHIADYPKPKSPAEHEAIDEKKERESSAPVLSERILKADSPQPAGESVLQPSIAAASVPGPLKNEQPGAPPASNQPRLDAVSSPAVTPSVLPAQSGAEASAAVPQGIPFDQNKHGAAMQTSGVPQMIKTFVSMFLYFLILGYLYFSLCLYFIARKLSISDAWIAWVPIFQIITLVKSASKPAWWALLLFIPLVNIIVQIYVWMCISENMGKDKWLGLLMLVPVANLIYLGMLAFSNQGSPSDVNVAVS